MITILVVDDSLTVRMDLTEALEDAGLRVIGAATLADARRVIAAHPVALVILDVILPDGDGLELLGWLRSVADFAELPVLMLSTAADIQDRVHGLRIGATDYIGKPYDTASVIARVRQLTERRVQPASTAILVIDDSETARRQLVQGLDDAGYPTLSTSDPVEGLRIAARERPRAIVVDGVMPGMDGPTLIRRIRLDAALRTTPCLLITGSEDAVAEIEALEAGADAFVRKDSDIELVVARLAAILRTAGEAATPSASLHAPKRILAIDHDGDFLAQLAELLHDAGYDVAQTTSGHEALELLSVQQVDCVLLDWQLPQRAGLDVCARIKAAPTVRDTPLIVLTGHDSRAAMLEALGAGADDFVSKTAGAEVLAARVRAQIRRRQVEDEQRRVREQLLRAELTDQLEHANAQLTIANEELEAFSYSVSHDLRAPLRAMGAFAQAVLEDSGDVLAPGSRDYLDRVVRAAKGMGEMIEALLELTRINRVPMIREPVDLSEKASALLDELAARDPQRTVATVVTPGLTTTADRRLVRVVLDNLLSNAWKFTSRVTTPRIEFGSELRDGGQAFYVRDNGAGFDMAQAARLFRPFHRLHHDAQFTGTGIGLATTRRIVERHGGRIWAVAAPDAGATFYVTFGELEAPRLRLDAPQ